MSFLLKRFSSVDSLPGACKGGTVKHFVSNILLVPNIHLPSQQLIALNSSIFIRARHRYHGTIRGTLLMAYVKIKRSCYRINLVDCAR